MSKAKKSMVRMVTFKACSVEIQPEATFISNIITAVEGQITVDKLFENQFGQMLAIGAAVVSGKTLDSYEDAAKAIGTEMDTLKKKVFDELDVRRKSVEAKFTGPEKMERLERVAQIKSRADNSFKSAKSVVTSAIRLGDQVLRVVTDGGHILWRSDGNPRGKTELQNLVKEAKSKARAPKSDFEKALDAGATYARRLSVLGQRDRSDIMKIFNEKLSDFIAEEWGEADESNDDDAPVAEAA